MNAITPAAQGAVGQSRAATPPQPPSLSRDLALDVARMTDPDPEARALRRFDAASFTPAQRSEAAWAAQQMREVLGRLVTRAELTFWLGQVNQACRNPQDEGDFRARLGVIAQDCAHLPAACFSAEGRHALYLQTRFFPSAPDVLAALEPIAKVWREKAAALARIATPVQAVAQEVPRRVPPSLAEVEHVTAAMTAFRQEMAERRQEAPAGAEARRQNPRHLTPVQLAMALRRQIAAGSPGASAALMRLTGLERQYGANIGRERA